MAEDIVSLAGHLALVDELFEKFRNNPTELDESWRRLFQNGPGVSALPNGQNGSSATVHGKVTNGTNGVVPHGSSVVSNDFMLAPLVNAYRNVGHLAANLDPLGLEEITLPPELEPAYHGISPEMMAQPGANGATGFDRIASLQKSYCGTVGLEFMHMSSPRRRDWLIERIEAEPSEIPSATRRRMLKELVAAEGFERFIHTKFPGTKRFSLEGGESLIPMLEEVLNQVGRHGGIEVVLGMAHRGRLNVLVQTLKKEPRDIFSEFQDIQPEATLGAGDVKYHLGYSCDRVDENGNTLHVSLAFNPSHLEAVDPVVVGRVRAKQRRHGDWDRRKIVGVLIHGDAAFAGQGLVAETLQLSNLHGYRTGGTVHIIVNNQIGFTAAPHEQRSTTYCTDIAKMIECPIWHVNGEDLDAVHRVVELAMAYRAEFQSDVVIDMYCYRKFGHNELDEPGFTQPLMYKRIQEKQSVDVMYAKYLTEQGIITEAELKAIQDSCREVYENHLQMSRAAAKRPVISTLSGMWAGYKGGALLDDSDNATGVPLERLREVSERMNSLPPDFKANSKVQKLLEQRLLMGRGEKDLDWGMAEMLSYGTLLWEGTTVRLSGQDSCRGTFSHRHAIVVNVDTGTEYMPLGHLHPEQGECRVYDSPLSEAAVMGFEFGYSLDFPDALVLWEAQFGDFANGAQVIIDQFLMTSEDKWNRLSGLVLLLPHGYEGQGPEHSSARIERFLQSAADDNVQIAQPSNPAQMFHLLRRQVHRPLRKPLVVFTPKSLLRLPAASSPLADLSQGSYQTVIVDSTKGVSNKSFERALLCSGRVYYDLAEEKKALKDDKTLLVRIEQLYPWPEKRLASLLGEYPGLKQLVWVQDEPSNMGPNTFVMPRLRDAFSKLKVSSVTRPESASPATGSHKAHGIEQRELLKNAFSSAK